MSNPKDDSEPAFACSGVSGLPNGDFLHGQPGMSLRDYLAAKAMQGMFSNSNWSGSSRYEIAEDAYAQADAMLEARES